MQRRPASRRCSAVRSAAGWATTTQTCSARKGREGRPQLDLMLKDAVRRRFDVAMVWALDRLGRSLADLIGSMQELRDAKVDLFIHQQGLDTTSIRPRDVRHVERGIRLVSARPIRSGAGVVAAAATSHAGSDGSSSIRGDPRTPEVGRRRCLPSFLGWPLLRAFLINQIGSVLRLLFSTSWKQALSPHRRPPKHTEHAKLEHTANVSV